MNKYQIIYLNLRWIKENHFDKVMNNILSDKNIYKLMSLHDFHIHISEVEYFNSYELLNRFEEDFGILINTNHKINIVKFVRTYFMLVEKIKKYEN